MMFAFITFAARVTQKENLTKEKLAKKTVGKNTVCSPLGAAVHVGKA